MTKKSETVKDSLNKFWNNKYDKKWDNVRRKVKENDEGEKEGGKKLMKLIKSKIDEASLEELAAGIRLLEAVESVLENNIKSHEKRVKEE